MAKTLIVRYSQIGDVLILIPVIYSLAKRYPQDEFTVLTNAKFSGIFRNLPANVSLRPMTYRKKNIPLRGLVHLFNRYSLLLKIASGKKYDKVALMQEGSFEDQLKSLLSLRKSRIARIDLKEFLSKDKLKNEDYLITPSLYELYTQTLKRLDYKDITPDFDISSYKDPLRQKEILGRVNIDTSKKLVGIAPFSRLRAKVYPLENIEKIIAHYNSSDNVQLLLFGGGDSEKRQGEEWKARYPNLVSLIGRMSFDDELTVMAACNTLLSMDSANLHLASLVKTPVVSIWGPSHPRLGYYPANQSKNNAVQQTLYCRPCSFWGENPCVNPQRYACMDMDPQVIINKTDTFIS